MKTRIEDISNFFGTALFIVLFLFVATIFSDRSNQQSIETVPHQLVNEWHANASQAIPNDAVQLPAFQKSWVSAVDLLNLHLFNPTFKLSSDNRKIAQRFFTLHQTGLVVKPFAMIRFYYHLFPLLAEMCHF